MYTSGKSVFVFTLLVSLAIVFLLPAFIQREEEPEYTVDDLRQLYSGDPARWPKPDLDSSVRESFQDIGVLGKPAYPVDNPYSPEKEKLGKLLFFDPRLSRSKQIACASCHDPELGWGDGRRVAYGHNRQTGNRNGMTLFNVGFYQNLFWDGRSASLEDQVQFPVQNAVEMAQELTTMEKNIHEIKGYKEYFKAAFGSEKVTVKAIQYAIATFERSIVSYPSRFDRFISGNSTILKDEEVRGLHLFRTKARCINCHNTPLFSDNQFHNDGQTLYGSRMQDFGRYVATKQKQDIGLFRTPSLREVAQTGPWMHHGNFPTLRDVVEYYNLGNPSPIQRAVVVDESMRPVTSPILRKLNLTLQERQDLEAFLRTLGTSPQRINPPDLPL